MTGRRYDELGPLAVGASLCLLAVTLRHPVPLAILLGGVLLVAPRPRWPFLALAGTGFLLNGLLAWHGETELWRASFSIDILGRPKITLEALLSGLATAMQIVIAAIAFYTAFRRTPPATVARMVPGRAARAGTVLAMSAFPAMVQDAGSMRHGLRLRGIDTHTPRGQAHLLVPLVARSLDRAAASHEVFWSRGSGAPVQALRPLHLGWQGIAALALAAAWALLLALDGTPHADYFPRLQLSGLSDWRTWVPLAWLPLLWRRP